MQGVVHLPPTMCTPSGHGYRSRRRRRRRRVSHIFNNIWLSRYPHPCKFVFEKGYEFKQDFTPLLKDFDIKPVLTTIKNPQANAPVQQVHQVIFNMIVTNYLDNKVFYYIYPWVNTLVSMECAIRASYHHNIGTTI